MKNSNFFTKVLESVMDSLENSSEKISHFTPAITDSLKGNIIHLTKGFNTANGSHSVHAFMDSAKGMGHRIEWGHDFSWIPHILEEYGFEGLVEYFHHIGKDFMSPHGVPTPFAKEIQQFLGLKTQTTIDFLSINIGKTLSGAFSIIHSVYVYKLLKSRLLKVPVLISVVMGSGLKIAMAIIYPNPISLSSGLFDFGFIFYFYFPKIRDWFFQTFSLKKIRFAIIILSFKLLVLKFLVNFSSRETLNGKAFINLQNYLKKMSLKSSFNSFSEKAFAFSNEIKNKVPVINQKLKIIGDTVNDFGKGIWVLN